MRKLITLSMVLLLGTPLLWGASERLKTQVLSHLDRHQVEEVGKLGDPAIPVLQSIIRETKVSKAPMGSTARFEAANRQGQAVYALGLIGTRQGVEALKGLLKDPQYYRTTGGQKQWTEDGLIVLQPAIQALSEMVRRDRQRAEAMAVLKAALDDPALQDMAVEALGEAKDARVVPTLQRFREVHKGDELLYLHSSLALAQLGDTGVLSYFTGLLDRSAPDPAKDRGWSVHGYRGLSYLAPKSEVAANRLRQEFLQHGAKVEYLIPIHWIVSGLLDANALDFATVKQVLQKATSYEAVDHVLGGMTHCENDKVVLLLRQVKDDGELKQAWASFGPIRYQRLLHALDDVVRSGKAKKAVYNN